MDEPTDNPYKPPTSEKLGVMTQEISRDSLAALIRSFVSSDITAFEFDDKLDPYRDSDDPVVNYVTGAVWYHYDECDDHLVCFSKPQWDFFQRLLLTLESDCQIESKSQRRWSIRQLIAAFALLGFAWVALKTGWGEHLFILSIPFGAISIALSFWRFHDDAEPDPYSQVIVPFATFSDLATAYRSTGFRKARYPKQIEKRTIRSPTMAAFWQIHAYTMWLILSPVPLLFQTLPRTQTKTRVVVA